MTILDKVRWALGLAVVFLLIVATGRSNVHNTKKIQAALEAVYADRLIVKGLIFDLRTLLHDKELALAKADAAYFEARSEAASERGLELLETFRGTKLVPREADALGDFARTWRDMMRTEAALAAGAEGRFEGEDATRLAEQLGRLKADISVLSGIQLAEGRRQLKLGDRAVEKMDLFAAVETYLLAALGAVAMLVVLLIPRRGSS